MPNVDEMYPSKWLKASDCEDGDLVLTIADIGQERIGQGSQADDKWVLSFEEEEKGLVLNKTNTNTIAKLYGPDTDVWIGKQVTLFATEVQFQGDMVEAIRVRSKPPRQAKAKPATKPATATANGDQPQSGKALFAWVKDQEQRHQVNLLKYLNGWAKLQELPARMVEWDAEQVDMAYSEACRKLQSIATTPAAVGADVPGSGDEGNDDEDIPF